MSRYSEHRLPEGRFHGILGPMLGNITRAGRLRRAKRRTQLSELLILCALCGMAILLATALQLLIASS